MLDSADGVVGGGNVSRPAIGGQPAIRNLCVWFQPSDPTEAGTFDSLGGGVNGDVYAAVVFGGQLYVVGTFTEAGGVAVKGIARWNGSAWGYVVNISDYGTATDLAVFDDELIAAGTFTAVDGQAAYKFAVRLDDELNKGALFTDLQSPEGNPIIRALYVNVAGDRLYMGGRFDLINDGMSVAANQVAYTEGAAGGWAWNVMNDNDAAPTNGINLQSGSVWSIAEYDGKIIVGCDPLAKGGASASTEALWRWDPASPDWTTLESGINANTLPVAAMVNNADATELYVAVRGAIGLESNTPLNRVRSYKVSSSNIWIGEGTQGTHFEVLPAALGLADAGQGLTLFICGAAERVGTVLSQAGAVAQTIAGITKGDRIVDVTGGCGVTSFELFVSGSAQIIQRGRRVVADEVLTEEQTANVAGTIGEGTFRVRVRRKDGQLLWTDPIDSSPELGSVVDAINAELAALLGTGKVVATGTQWTGLKFEFRGIGYSERNNRLLEFDVEDLDGATGVQVTRTRTVKAAHLAVVGAFGHTNHGLAQNLCGIDMHGALCNVNGFTTGSYRVDLAFGSDSINDVRCEPRDEWPAELTDPAYCDLAAPGEPFINHGFLIVGSQSLAVNQNVRLIDVGRLREGFNIKGLAFWYGGYLRDLKIKADLFGYPATGTFFDGKLVVSGGFAPPHYYDWAGEQWFHFSDPDSPGNLTTSAEFLYRWGGYLWALGPFQKNGSSLWWPLAKISTSGATTMLEPVGFPATSNQGSGFRHAVSAVISGVDTLFLAGDPDDNENSCPVVMTTDGANFSAVGGSSLRGLADSLALRFHADGSWILVSTGALEVNDGGGWIETHAAYYDGSWHAIGTTSGFAAIPRRAIFAEFAGRQAGDDPLGRVVIGGPFVDFNEDSGLGGDHVEAFGLVQFRDLPAPNVETFKGRTGINGVMLAAASAGERLFP